MKGIILAGGSGTRLSPATSIVSKQLLPIYDKPMIYYPFSVLLLAGITEVLIISTPKDISLYQKLFGDGSYLGIKISYAIQENPNGLAEAFLIGEDFINGDDVCLILGDNILYGNELSELLEKTVRKTSETKKATIFGYYVSNPRDFGVVSFNEQLEPISIIEKPKFPESNYAVIGIYFYPNSVIEIAKKVKPSNRGELEITSINQVYLQNNNLNLSLLSRGYTWLDTGTFDSMLSASNFVKTIESRQGLKIACIEEISYEMGLITHEVLTKSIDKYSNTDYGKYLKDLLNRKKYQNL